jgi:putative membrane protein
MVAQLPYCGAPPGPETLLFRFNLDPILIAVLVLAALVHLRSLRGSASARTALLGWGVTSCALLSPLCALSVSLFSARVAQHMVLILVAAPLLALALPALSEKAQRPCLWVSVTTFFIALWFWHMPRPYDATFDSTAVYWAMHVTLFGSAIALWRSLLQPARSLSVEVVVAGALTSMQMGFLGAVLASASRPLFFWHLTTTQAWGLTPLEDQQLGGVFMWVPGILLFLWAAVHALGRMRSPATRPKTA